MTEVATTCANCSAAALYVYEITAEASQVFCAAHLPRFLRSKGAPVALVKRTEEHARAKSSATKKLAPKKAAEKSLMVEAPTVEVGDTSVSKDDESEVTPTNEPAE